jgi:hypothetical protein
MARVEVHVRDTIIKLFVYFNSTVSAFSIMGLAQIKNFFVFYIFGL